jgi:ATP-binding cassette subfamily F protein 3
MIVINLSKISLILGARPIFSELDWRIQNDQKIGLIGPNGAGKSSLFKLISGEFAAEPGGRVIFAKDISFGYLAQDPELPPDQTAFETALAGNPRWRDLQAALKQVEIEMGDPRVYNNPKALTRAIEAHERHLEEYLALGGDSYPERVRQVLSGLGLDPGEHDKTISTLSGGQKKLVGLARLLLAQPPVLLLDEPDNHLDLNGKAYLEQLIQTYPGAVVIVSHDRYLLDAVVTHIAELEDGRLTTFQGDYSSFVMEKELRLARQEELYRVQQREIHRLAAAIKRYALWGKVYDNEKFAARARAMQNRLDRMDKIERPIIERKRMAVELSGWRGSTKVLEICGLEKSFDGQTLFQGLDIQLQHGQRAGFIGPNGAGKSLLLRIILGNEMADAGEIKVGPSIVTGYYAQEHETLDPEMTLIDTVRYAVPEGRSMSESNAVAFLSRYLFTYQQATQKVGDLSGGERSRLQIALLVLSGANFLLLDEPTNNLDIASAEVLEQALDEFEGTVLVISHDRYFLDRVVDRILVLEAGEIHAYPGNYSDYAERKQSR